MLACLPTLPAAADQAQQDAWHFEQAHERAAELLLVPLLDEYANRKTGLELLLGVPRPIRSAAPNVLQELRSTGQARKSACDSALAFLLAEADLPNIRARSASGLSGGLPEIALPALIAALQDESSEVRMFACQSLMFQKDPASAPAVAALLDDPSPQVRHVAVRTLGWLGNKNALPKIRQLYAAADPSANESWVFVDAFARLGDDESAIKAAPPLLLSTNYNVRYFVVKSLGLVESDAVVPLLIAALSSEMKLELQRALNNRRLPERTFTAICEELARRTEQPLGTDPTAWMQWWQKNHDKYGVSPEEATVPSGFDELAARFKMEVDRKIEPKKEQPEYANIVVTFRAAEPPAANQAQESSPLWSETHHGVRVRLFAKPEYRPGHPLQLLMLVQCNSDAGATVPGPQVSPWLHRAESDRQDHTLHSLRDRSKILLGPGKVQMIAINVIGHDPQVTHQEWPPPGAPSQHPVVLREPLKPGTYEFRASYNPAVEENGEDDQKLIVTPAIVIKILDK